MAERGLLFFESTIDDGRWCCIAVKIVDQPCGEVVTLGTGLTCEEARADCKNDLLSLGYSEAEATPGVVAWGAPING